MQIEVVLAWPQRHVSRRLELPAGASVADAVAAAALDLQAESVAYAVHGIIAKPAQVLCDGDRVELLRPLLADPKEARRRRARPA